MEHLTLEALARLVDETPSRSERRHLAECPSCAEELESLGRQTDALGSLPALRPAPGDWEALEARLESEGLIQGGDVARLGARFFGVRRSWMQVAGALAVFAAGGAMGAQLASGEGALGEDARLLTPTDVSVAQVATPEEAAEHVRFAEQQYYDAVLRYRELTSAGSEGSPPDPGRFAAIDALVAASQAAVQQAPDDPFLNGFLVSAVAERQATLRRISTAGTWY